MEREKEEEKKKEAETEVDADTGQEILYFVRTVYRWIDTIPLKEPIHVLMLRDMETKRFIRRLKTVELRVYMVVDYSVERAKKGNPLYIDAVGTSQLKPKEFKRRDVWEWAIEKALTTKVAEEFGYYVAKDLLDLAGYEYGSEIKVEEKIQDLKAHYVKVWKHKPEERGATAEGTMEI